MIKATSIYVNRPTVLHGLDPRAKIAGFIFLSVLLLVFNDPRYLAAMVLCLLALAVLGHSLGNYNRVRSLALFLFLTSWVAWQFYIRGQVVARLGPITLTRQGILYGLSAGMRVSSALLLGTLFLSVTGIEELTVGLIRLGLPYRLGFVISVTARLVPLLTLTLGDIIQVQTARGVDLTTRNPFKRARRLFPVLVPFLVFSARHASRLSMALESKGFRPNAPRSYYLRLVMRPRDLAVVLALLGLTALSVTWRLMGHGAVVPGRI